MEITMTGLKHLLLLCSLTLAAPLLCPVSPGAAQAFSFTAIDVPCSGCLGGIAQQTLASGINPAGDIVGSFTDQNGQQHGFLLSRGQVTTLDPPGALTTNANGISPSGEIVGNYTVPVSSAPPGSPKYCPAASPACIKGFLYSHGRFTSVSFPGHPGAIPQRITPDGDIYGCLHDTDLGMSMFGAVWSRWGDVSLTPSGGELADSTQSVSMSMNNGATPGGGLIVGLWTDMSNHRHGFQVQNEVFQSFDVPGSTLTAIWDINPSQQFVGTYVDGAGHRHGFLQLPDGSAPLTVDFPGAASTVAFGINPDGVIVGQYSRGGHLHGFVATPAGTQ
jgi:probable HAF family extracellular repeat protein